MFYKCTNRLWLSVFLILACVITLSSLSKAAQADWFNGSAPAITPGLTYTQRPEAHRYKCSFWSSADGTQTSCLTQTSLGAISYDSKILVDGHLYPLTDSNGEGIIYPISGTDSYLEVTYATGWGAYVKKYTHLNKSNLEKHYYSGLPIRIQYELNVALDDALKYDTGELLKTSGPPLAISSNGEWMVFDVPNKGLMRIDREFKHIVPVAPSPSSVRWNKPVYFAISNSGKHIVAASTDTMQIYGVETCEVKSFGINESPMYEGCGARTIWDANSLSRQHVDLPENTTILGNPRFIDDDNFSIDIQSGSGASASFKNVYITAPGAQLHKLLLLGMGDSYISGEGTQDYRPGTDTSDNKCHLSDTSYPILIGAKFYDSYNSVACSGAITEDLKGLSDKYTGQTKIHIELRNRNPKLAHILLRYTPGVAQQQNFTHSYSPRAVILSAGGNNVGFADIVKSCVEAGDCYSSYEDRLQKIEEIQNLFQELKNTYNAIYGDGVENLYVVGYPSVAKNDGDCGLNVHLSNNEIKFSNQLISYLNQTIEAAATSVGARYVDIQDALIGHRLCEASDSSIAVNGLTVGNDKGFYVPYINWQLGPIDKGSYHPNQLGHRLIEKAVLAQTNELTQLMPHADDTVLPPEITNDMPLLKGLEPSDDWVKLQTVRDLTNGTLVRGTDVAVQADSLQYNLQPNTDYVVELHSKPVRLGTITSDSEGNIDGTVHIPDDVPAGFHAINVYGEDFGNEPIQLQKLVYVAASADDFDGDGTNNIDQACVFLPASGVDYDEDGIDDACDPVIGAKPENKTTSTTEINDKDSPDAPVNHTQNRSDFTTAQVLQLQHSQTLAESTPSRTTSLRTETSGEVKGSHTAAAAVTSDTKAIAPTADHTGWWAIAIAVVFGVADIVDWRVSRRRR